ncbi:MAG: glycoside hydrolase family 2 TIM barrel-domain containing protein [Bacteroidota bacterium]|jgi:hypothetical protein
MKFLPPHILIFIQIIFSSIISSQSPIKVEIKKDGENWQLIRDGKPYYIKGAGGSVYMDQMVANGANSLRTWGAERAGEILDEAHKHGLTVMLGLWVQHERHGFDYDNKNKIQKQLNDFREIVLKYKDHPALLLWGVGNEVDLNYTNTNVWDAINDIAKMIHELDPNHPTSTVTAGLDSQEVVLINKKAPHIDIYGINTYADINYVKDNIRKFGWKGPYMITEWGPTGHWESPTTEWGYSIEANSSQKLKIYQERYEKYIFSDQEKCFGSYAFLWGQKQEYTNSWYGIFTSKGEPTETIDALHYSWKREFPTKKAPSVDSLLIDGKTVNQNVYLKPGETYEVSIKSFCSTCDKLKYDWTVRQESSDLKSGGDVESEPDELTGVIKKVNQNSAKIKSPNVEGAYRLFVSVKGNGKVAYANFPFYVLPKNSSDSQKQFVKFKNQTLESFYESTEEK